MDPFYKWVGGKRWLVPKLLAELPQRISGVYREPFLGGGAAFLALAAAGRLRGGAALSDANPDLVACWEAARDEPDALCEALGELAAHENVGAALGPAVYLHYRALVGTPDGDAAPLAERGARFLFLLRAGWNGLWRVNRHGRMNVPWGKRRAFPTADSLQDLQRAARAAGQLLRDGGAVLRVQDFADALRMACKAPASAVVYADPPYLPRSATASFAAYATGHLPAPRVGRRPRRAGWAESDQRRLVRLLCSVVQGGGRAWLSGPDTPAARLILDQEVPHRLHELGRREGLDATAATRGMVRELLAEVLL